MIIPMKINMKNRCPMCKNYRFTVESDIPRPCLKCNSHRQYKLKEIDVCLGCGKRWPCKSDCPCGTGKSLVRQD